MEAGGRTHLNTCAPAHSLLLVNGGNGKHVNCPSINCSFLLLSTFLLKIYSSQHFCLTFAPLNILAQHLLWWLKRIFCKQNRPPLGSISSFRKEEEKISSQYLLNQTSKNSDSVTPSVPKCSEKKHFSL